MTTKRLLLTAVIVWVLLAFTIPTLAQTRGDRDGDGLPNSVDKCPDQPGPRENGGCPLPDTSGGGGSSQDRDSDGVLDCVDLCLDQTGIGLKQFRISH